MSAPMVASIPLVLLGLVAALCFVGCAIEAGGLDLLGPYQDNVTKDLNIVACWPLSDRAQNPSSLDGLPAVDIGPNKLNGSYNSSAGPVQVQRQQIVPGDVPPSGPPHTCAFFNGGFVSVPFADVLNQGKFTVEAWVSPSWGANDMAVRGVVVSLNSAANAGYALFVQNNSWTAGVGTGAGNPLTTVSLPVIPNTVCYLAMTFDGSKLTLFMRPINGDLKSASTTVSGTFLPEKKMTTETPLYIGKGRPDLPAGADPLDGFVQDVAVYGDAISVTTINTRFGIGKGG